MKMVFEEKEIHNIIKEHLVEKLGVPESNIGKIWFYEYQHHVDIETDNTGTWQTGPYRSKL